MYLMKEGGIVSSVDPASGKILKQGHPEALEEYYASPVAADGKVFLVSASGDRDCVKPTRNGRFSPERFSGRGLGNTCNCR